MRFRSASGSSRALRARAGSGSATRRSTPSALRRRLSPSLTVIDVDRAIDEIERATGPGSARARGDLLAELLGRATEAEAAFLRRLFTGELRQGALAGVMADAVAKAAGVRGEIARRALMLSGDLTRMAQVAMTDGRGGAARRSGSRSSGRSSRCSPRPAPSVAEAMSGFELSSVEWKLDGIRIQIHRRDRDVRIYTRNLNEITATLPGIVEAAARPAGAARRCSTARRCGCATGLPPRSRTPCRRSTATPRRRAS